MQAALWLVLIVVTLAAIWAHANGRLGNVLHELAT